MREAVEELDVDEPCGRQQLSGMGLRVPPPFGRSSVVLRCEQIAGKFDLEPLFGVPQLVLRLSPLTRPGTHGRAIRRSPPLEQQRPAGVERLTWPPLEGEGPREDPVRLEVFEDALRGFTRCRGCGHELKALDAARIVAYRRGSESSSRCC